MEENKRRKARDVFFGIPGMGVDGRVFGKLQEFLPIQPIEWMLPAPQESLRQYAGRMAAKLPPGEVSLIGYSFGGVVAQEIASIRPQTRVILVNSLRFPNEKPVWLRFMRKVPLYRLTQGSWRIRTMPLWGGRYGIQSAEEREILSAMFRAAPDPLRMWSVQQLASWEGADSSHCQLRIHGTKDNVLSASRVRGEVHWMEGGKHFMIWQQADLVAALILHHCRG